VILLLLQVDAADNIDLLTVLQEFEESYEAKYGRRPKLVRRVGSEEASACSCHGYSSACRTHASCSNEQLCVLVILCTRM
jgi:hypothetical protein